MLPYPHFLFRQKVPKNLSDIRWDAMKPLTRQLSFFIRNNA